ncbi:hypothetical protein TNCV_2528961 [Trichonephila clavipes]|nr:hypothetical protein TNCV_2528961 [Trichonephila clavipes]
MERIERTICDMLMSKQSQIQLSDILDMRTAHSVKNPETHPGLKVGDVVLIEENTKNKYLWKLVISLLGNLTRLPDLVVCMFVVTGWRCDDSTLMIGSGMISGKSLNTNAGLTQSSDIQLFFPFILMVMCLPFLDRTSSGPV